MTALALLATVLAAQSATSLPGPDIALMEVKQVGYQALAAGDAEQAVAELETRLEVEPHDPAVLINLGAAYARLGRHDLAAAAYQTAIDSETRYRLELSDGRWIDSRHAARMAMTTLNRAPMLARR